MPDIARFTQLLFADQSLDQLLELCDIEARPKEGAWALLVGALAKWREGKHNPAIELLLEITARPNLETRVLLWSWSALRSLGVYPDAREASEIKGVVVQVPVERAVDVLAGYADGTARYVNHMGKIIVWDLPDGVISSLIQRLLHCSSVLPLDTSVSACDLPNLVRVTVLTIGGNHVLAIPLPSLPSDSPLNRVLSVGAELMANLIKRTGTMNQLMQQHHDASER